MSIAVLGAGAWGTAFALAQAPRHTVTLWSWQTEQPAVSPIQTAEVVSVRSRVYSTRYSSGIVPPSLVVMLQRLKPEAIC